jgi:hypothetical protein
MKTALRILSTFAFFSFTLLFVFAKMAIAAELCPQTGPVGVGPDMKTRITDTDQDKVYHSGDNLQFEYEGNLSSTRDFLKVAFVVVTPGGTVNAEVIDGLTLEGDKYILNLGESDITRTPLGGGLERVGFTIDGTIQANLPIGGLAAIIMTSTNPDNNVFIPLVKQTTVDGQVRNLWTYYAGREECEPTNTVNALVGVPSTFGNITSNIGEIENLHNTEKTLTFTRSMGSISFGAGLNIVGNWQELANLEDFVTIAYDSDTNEMKIAVDTDSLTFLADKGATIRFVGVAYYLGLGSTDIDESNFRDYLHISVFDTEGQEIANPPFNWNNATYDSDTHTLTLPIDHFTEYALGTSYETEVEEENGGKETERTTKTPTSTEKDDDKLPETGRPIVLAFLLGFAIFGGHVVLRKYKFLQ